MSNVKKKIKIFIAGVVGLGLLLFVALIIHIAIMVRSRPPLVDATIQMARVDFRRALTDSQKAEIQKNVMNQQGAQSVYYNPQTEVLVYTFDNRKNNAESIYNKAVKPLAMYSRRITVSEADMANGCPAFDSHSFYGKLTAIVSEIVQ
ncbi:MAG TPA: hypothetical protein VFL76_01705 [Edaphocola sp.]|nr:hypothetical protein [Edaphocola sp.]